MREVATESDSTGTTVFAYYQDGTQKSQTDPANNTTTYNTPNEQANQPVTTTLPDGTTQSDTFDEQGNLVAQGGSALIAATFGYDTGGTGELTSVKTAAGTTNWAYDLNTGQLQSKTFADQTQDVFKYNDKGLLSSESLPGVNAAFGYDAYGNLTSASYKDSVTGVLQVQSLVTQQDDLGRPLVTTSLDNGQITSEADTYTPTGDLGSEIFGSAGSTAVTYGYDPTNNAAGTGGGDADAVSSLTASTPGEQTVSQGYTYDSDGRLATITVNGVTLTYHYLGDSDQIQTITAGDVTTAYTPQANDGSLLQGIKVTAGTQDVYLGGYTYNADDQRATDSVTQTDATGNTTSQSLGYTYDPNLADALTQVKDGSNNLLYSFDYTAAGDFLGNATLGTANSVNEYSNLIYNARHDLTGDGTYTYGYDPLDRLICVRPDNHTNGTLAAQFGYDSQGRMQWENVYAWWGSWTLSTTYHFVWSGDELIEKLDGNDKVLQQYTWGPGQDGNDHVLLLTDFTGTSPHTYTLAYDASGNVSMLLDPATGAVIATYSYAPYGALVSSTGNATLNPWLGKGYWTDAAAPGIGWAQPDTADGAVRETKFTFGLWMEDDPTGINGGLDPNSVDGNDPINNIDSNGTNFISDLFRNHADAVHDDAGSPVPGERTYAQIRAEAVAAAKAEFHLSGDVPADQVVAPGKTFGGVVDWYYNEKYNWYYYDQQYYVVSDEQYATDLAVHNEPNTVKAWTEADQANADRLNRLKNSGAPNSDYVYQFYLSNPNPTFLDVLSSWADKAVPDMAAAYASLASSSNAAPTVAGRVAPQLGPEEEDALYDVGLAKDLRRTSIPYTQVHHVGQSAQAESLIGDFNAVNKVGNEPAIRITESEHEAINTAQANYPVPSSARDLLARDIRLVRNNTDAPNSALQRLIQLNKDLHTSDYKPLHRQE